MNGETRNDNRVFTDDERRAVLSMGRYWREVAQREGGNAHEIFPAEAQHLLQEVGAYRVLMAVLATAEREEEKDG